jgi:predicted RecA/RadA family phage recombinase
MAAPSVQFRYGEDVLYAQYTPGSSVSAGDVVVQGDMVGVATLDIAANALGDLAISGCVFSFPKTAGTGEAIAAGALCYWDAGSSVATTTAGSNKKIGLCTLAAGASATTVEIALGTRN